MVLRTTCKDAEKCRADADDVRLVVQVFDKTVFDEQLHYVSSFVVQVFLCAQTRAPAGPDGVSFSPSKWVMLFSMLSSKFGSDCSSLRILWFAENVEFSCKIKAVMHVLLFIELQNGANQQIQNGAPCLVLISQIFSYPTESGGQSVKQITQTCMKFLTLLLLIVISVICNDIYTQYSTIAIVINYLQSCVDV